ncbi:hypothetical protein LCGC14_2867790 [marine sediment metagenome]|uniref:Ice-binding protein C-terminal domain-containing protein n=1 Tax=marine sediment metagenome TaxID=412755 RepID=A0A0F8YQJ6_9ZZZZ
MNCERKQFAIAGLLVTLLCVPVVGDVITRLDGDTAAAVSGSVAFSETGEWLADVEYAVYAPGAYPGDHSDSSTQWIYAYQAFCDSGSTMTLASLSVGLLEGSGAASATDDSTHGEPGGVAPLLSRLVGTPPTSVQWTIDVDAGEHTTVLLFSSPYSHTFDSATLANGGDGDTDLLPTPVPEPTTLSLLLLGGVVLARRIRKTGRA